jgi:hypothetical protein
MKLKKPTIFYIAALLLTMELYMSACDQDLVIENIHHQGDLVMEAVRTSEILVNLYQSTRPYNPEDRHLPYLSLAKYRVINKDVPSCLLGVLVTNIGYSDWLEKPKLLGDNPVPVSL